MKKRVLAGLLAAMLIIGTGCAGEANAPGADDSHLTDSGNESGIASEEADTSGDTGLQTESELSGVPADTESVAASEETRGFLFQDEGSDEGKVYNIFCGDEKFKDLVSAYCEDYEEDTEGAVTEENRTIIKGRIGDAEIRWIISSEVGELYLTGLDLSLTLESDINEVTDLYIVDAADVQKYVDRDVHAAMSLVQDVGISSHALVSGYEYSRRLGSDDDGLQRAVSWEVSPGMFMYNRQAAIDVLGSDDPAAVQEMLADWDSFDAVAAKAAECGYAMLEDWNESFDAFAAGISGDWLTETGGVKIDEALLDWTDQSERYIKEGYFANGSDRPCFGTFISADELMELVRGTDLSAEDFESSYGICAGPAGWYRGGSYVVVNSACDQRALTKKILGQVMFNDDVLRDMKAEGLIPNNSVILAEERSDTVSAGGKSLSGLTDLSGEEDGFSDAGAETADSGALTDDVQAADSEAFEADSKVTDSEVHAADSEATDAGADTADDDAADANAEAGITRSANPSGPSAEAVRTFLGGQDPYPVFAEAAGRVSLGEVSVFGVYLCDMYEREYASYLAGEKTRDDAMKTFYTEIRDLISEEE